jgi:ABC-type ATPase involved in cell division
MISFSQVRKSYRGGYEALVELSFKIALLASGAGLGWLGAHMSVSKHLSAMDSR